MRFSINKGCYHTNIELLGINSKKFEKSKDLKKYLAMKLISKIEDKDFLTF